MDAPGGGQRVRLVEPNGYTVDVIAGFECAEPLAVSRQEINSTAHPLRRAGELYRLQRGGPTPVRRLAHLVLVSPKFAETMAWFRTVLGFIPSDNITVGPAKALIGSFMRVDCGDDYVDYHTLAVVAGPRAGVQHLSFESQDVDAVLSDHHYCVRSGATTSCGAWGVTSQAAEVFDYWMDPNGIPHEHWADSDRLNANTPANDWDIRKVWSPNGRAARTLLELYPSIVRTDARKLAIATPMPSKMKSTPSAPAPNKALPRMAR